MARRPLYRARQFFRALGASLPPLSAAEQAEAHTHLPESAWPLFDAMSRADQRHSLNVLRTVVAVEPESPAIAQAALLHDCAKTEGGIRLWHRVAVVLVKAFWPGAALAPALRGSRDSAGLARGSEDSLEPLPGGWRRLLWVHVLHPQRGAELAAAAGCDPLAVVLIRRHQDEPPSAASDLEVDRMLAVLQAADNDN